MAVPIVATPGGVVQAFSQGTSSGLDLANAIMLNKKVSPELANLLQHTYNTINKQPTEPAQDDTQPDLSSLGDNEQPPQGQPAAGPGRNLQVPTVGDQPVGPPAPPQAQVPAQAAPQQGGGLQAALTNPQFMKHFHDRVAAGEDPAQLGKEARLAAEGHLPNHPAHGNQPQGQPDLSGLAPTQQPQQTPAGQVNFGNLTNRDLETARAMVADTANYQARKNLAQMRYDASTYGTDTRANTAANTNQTRTQIAANTEAGKGARSGANLTERTRHDQATEATAKQRADAQEERNKIAKSAAQFHGRSSYDPRTEEGKNARADLQAMTRSLANLESAKSLNPKAVSDEELNTARQAVAGARQRIGAGGGQTQQAAQIPSDQQAIDYAKAHPEDPNSKAVLDMHGIK